MIDTSPPGSWRHALDPEHISCRACGQNICGCSDAAYQGIAPATATRPEHATARPTSGGEGAATAIAVPSLHRSLQPFHASGVSRA